MGIIFFLKAILTNDVDNRAANYISFFHQKFQRGKPDLLADIKRLVVYCIYVIETKMLEHNYSHPRHTHMYTSLSQVFQGRNYDKIGS